MSPYYLIIMLFGANTLYVRITELTASLKSGNRQNAITQILLLLMTGGVLFFLISLKK